MLWELLVGQSLCDGCRDWVFVGSKECCKCCFFFRGTGEKPFLGLLWVKCNKVIAREVDLQANDVGDLLVDIEVENPPDCF